MSASSVDSPAIRRNACRSSSSRSPVVASRSASSKRSSNSTGKSPRARKMPLLASMFNPSIVTLRPQTGTRYCRGPAVPENACVTPTTHRLPSAGFSITIRVAVRADASAIGRLTTAVGDAGGIVTAVDVVDSDPTTVVVDLTCDTADSPHAEQVVDRLEQLDGVDVRKVSARTFLLHLGGTIRVAPT